MTDTPTPPDGWYPDPAGGGGLRRWNGSGWTDEVRSASGEVPASSGSPTEAADVESASTPASDSASERDHGSADGSPAYTDAAQHGRTATDAGAQHDAAHHHAESQQPDSAVAPQHAPAVSDYPATSQPAAAHEAPRHGDADSPATSEPTAESASGAPDAASSTSTDDGPPSVDAAPAVSVPPVTPPVPPVTPPAAPVAPPSTPAYSSAPAFPSAPSYPTAPAYPAAPSTGYGATAGYQSAPPVAYDTAPRRDINTNTVWVWLLVFLPLVSVLGLVIFDWTSYIRDSFYAGVYSYDSDNVSTAGTSMAGTMITAVSSLVSLVITALTVLFAFLDWRQLRARGVERPFHWAWSFFVLVIGSALVYIIGRAVILRRRTASGLAPMWASIVVNVVVVIAFTAWVVVLMSQLFSLMNEFSTYGY